MDTIVAIATPPGRGGVGIVRVSGKDAYKIGIKISQLSKIKPRQAMYVPFYANNQEIIDKGILIYFANPHSYTGEDVIEIQAHGSPIVLDTFVKECVNLGARIANPGEFSERAFLNDKIDLTQAEAIADLINASSNTAAKLAVRSLQGEFSEKIHELSNAIIHLRLYVEAAIDFPDEEIDFLADGKVANMLKNIMQDLHNTIQKAHCGTILREGLAVVIAGSPNAGKSTLINCLAGRDVAIVTDVAGTTRDVMREHVIVDDIPLHIIDTAGIRESDDVVEKEGIKRALDEVRRADLVIQLTDIKDSTKEEHLNSKILENLPKNTPIIRVFNKIDKIKDQDTPTNNQDNIYISAKNGSGITNLINRIKEIVGYQPAEGQFLARRRHMQALEDTQELLISGENALISNLSGELLAEDLRQAHHELSKITGEFSSDDLLGAIFSSFCIGK